MQDGTQTDSLELVKLSIYYAAEGQVSVHFGLSKSVLSITSPAAHDLVQVLPALFILDVGIRFLQDGTQTDSLEFVKLSIYYAAEGQVSVHFGLSKSVLSITSPASQDLVHVSPALFI